VSAVRDLEPAAGPFEHGGDPRRPGPLDEEPLLEQAIHHRAADRGLDARRLVSEAKKVASDAAWQAVNHAMQDELVSLESARRDYGVAFTGSAADWSLAVDEAETRRLRARSSG